METFFYTIAFSIISVTTIIAYKHHDSYPRIARIIFLTCTTIGAIVISHSIGYTSGYYDAGAEFGSNRDQFEKYKRNLDYIYLGAFGFAAYSQILINFTKPLGLNH